MTDEAQGQPVPNPPAPVMVDIEERSIDLGTVFNGVTAASGVAAAAGVWYGATRQPPQPPQDPPPAPTIELPPGVDRGGDSSA